MSGTTSAPSRIAHGGFVVARHEGVVVFVRHALPGERVVVEVTEGQEGDRFLRADAVEVLEASPDRVDAALPVRAVPDAAAAATSSTSRSPAQRALKAAVVAEQLQRLAGLDVDVDGRGGPRRRTTGCGWRTRVQWAVARDGRPGLRKHRSHDVVPVDDCRDRAPRPARRHRHRVAGRRRRSRRSSPPPASSCGWSRTRDGAHVRRRAAGAARAGRRPRLAGHRLRLLAGAPGRRRHAGRRRARRARPAAGGAGARPLRRRRAVLRRRWPSAVGPTGHVVAVESDEAAVEDAAANLADLHAGLGGRRTGSTGRSPPTAAGARDLVVLDPPRTGAKRDVVAAIAAPRPRGRSPTSPATRRRWPATWRSSPSTATRCASLRAFDLFPMTHHVECVAVLVPGRRVS